MSNTLGDISNVGGAGNILPEAARKRPNVRIPSKGQTAGPPADFAQESVKGVKTAALKLSEVERVAYGPELKNSLKPGDILLSYYPKSSDVVAFGIKGAQSVARVLTAQGEGEADNFVHAAMYVGNGKISEAVADGIRVNDLSRMEPTQKSGHKVLVVRHENSALAQEAANIAVEIAADSPQQQAAHGYSILKALGAVVTSDNQLKEDGVKRFLKGAVYTGLGIKPTDANGVREFYCSYFIGWAFQAGEAKDVLEKVNNLLAKSGQRITFPEIDPTWSPKQQGEVLEKWATGVVEKHYTLLRDAIQLKLDPKLTTPSHLYNYFMQNPEVYSQVCLVEAAPRTMKAAAGAINDVALSSLDLKKLASGKDKQVLEVRSTALKQSESKRAAFESKVFIEALHSSGQKLVSEEFALMKSINDQLGALANSETNLALDFEVVRTSDGKTYYSTEKAVGNAEKIIRDQSLSFSTRVGFCRQVINGMKNLHATNRVHGDFKPDNLLVFEGGVLRVADFGKSATVDGDNVSRKKYAGNTRFGPPEGKLSKAGDVYGNGLVLMRILEEGCLKGRATLLQPSVFKDPPSHSSRRGVEKFILDDPSFERSFETKEQGIFGGRGKDAKARVLTVGGLIPSEALQNETVALRTYIGALCDELVRQKLIPDYSREMLELLLIEMTDTDPKKRPTMEQVAERFEAIFFDQESDVESSGSMSLRSSSGVESTEESNLRPVLVRGAEMAPLGKGKVNTVYKVTYKQQNPVNGEMETVTGVFKPEQPVAASIKEKLWGTAAGSGIPTGKDANLAGRSVASSVVDKMLFREATVSVNTRFAIVNGQKGILMDKAQGKSPEVTGYTERVVATSLEEFKKIVGDDPVTPEFLASMLEADRVEVREGSKLVAVNKTFAHFDPNNLVTAEELLKLQVLDIICGQVDRHPGNYHVDEHGHVTAFDNDCSFGVHAMPKGVDVRRQPTLGGIVPNMGSLMLRMPKVITRSIADDILTLWNNAEELNASLKGLISPAEIAKTIERLEMLVHHVFNPKECKIIADDQLLAAAQARQHRPEAERLINSDNSYWAREVYKFRSDASNLNYLRANALL